MAAAGAGMSAKEILAVISRLEQKAAAEKAAWKATEAEIRAWRTVMSKRVNADVQVLAGFEAKRPKVEPPPSPVASPSSDSDDSSTEDGDGAERAEAAPVVAPPLPLADPVPVAGAAAAAPPPSPAPAAPKRAARAVGKRGAKPPGPKVLRVCPPGWNPDGTPAGQCEFGRKVEHGLSTAGAPHSHTCPCSRFWKWDILGPRAEEERAKFEAWKAAGAQ